MTLKIYNWGLGGHIPILDEGIVATRDQMELITNWVLNKTYRACVRPELTQ